MRRVTLAVSAGLAAAALAMAACTPSSESMNADAPEAETAAAQDKRALGRRLAETQCVRCHAVAADMPSRNPDAPPLRQLAERYPATLLEDAFPQRMNVGHPAMPEFPFSDAEIDALLEFLLSIQERQGA